jgi:hypothetical protein
VSFFGALSLALVPGLIGVLIALGIAGYQGLAPAPVYTETPNVVLVVGLSISGTWIVGLTIMHFWA